MTTSKQTEEDIPEKKQIAVKTAQKVTPKKEKATPQNSPEKKTPVKSPAEKVAVQQKPKVTP